MRPISYLLSPISVLAMALLALSAIPAQAQLIPSFGSDRAGTSGFQFLKIPVDARAAAMGETVASNGFDASALFWNPALAAQAVRTQVGLSHTSYFADVAVYYAGGFHRFGQFTFGLSVQALDSGEMDVTTEFEPFGTGESFRLMDMGVGLTVAQQLTDLFSYGVTAKYVREDVAGLTTNTAVFDLGVFYRVGDTGAQMAVAIRNFGFDGAPGGELERLVIGGSGTVTETNFESFTPPTTFSLGLTYHLFRNSNRSDLLVSGQLTNPNDNAESFNVGAEYAWNDLLILRGGYRIGVEEYTWPSFGAGFVIPGIRDAVGVRMDYGFSRLDRLGTVHRVGVNFDL